jgi:hypothetical protein
VEHAIHVRVGKGAKEFLGISLCRGIHLEDLGGLPLGLREVVVEVTGW